jgi:hypothetical protein
VRRQSPTSGREVEDRVTPFPACGTCLGSDSDVMYSVQRNAAAECARSVLGTVDRPIPAREITPVTKTIGTFVPVRAREPGIGYVPYLGKDVLLAR